MKHLIINADDFGMTAGINRGIVEAHVHGVVTSASLTVGDAAAGEAARLARDVPGLSVGLHVKITDERMRPALDFGERRSLRTELRRQFDRFHELLGRSPAHLDSHHNVHFLDEVAPCFRELAEAEGLPLRGFSGIRYFRDFYGQWDDGTRDLEHIGVESLLGMLEREVGEGFTELGCHPGYVDPSLDSSYAVEREAEVRSLCDPRVPAKLDELGIELLSSVEARDQLLAASPEG